LQKRQQSCRTPKSTPPNLDFSVFSALSAISA
jgi:hypothetical protein